MTCAFQFFKLLLELIEQHSIQKPDVFSVEEKSFDNETEKE